jgi:hypothetical protein
VGDGVGRNVSVGDGDGTAVGAADPEGCVVGCAVGWRVTRRAAKLPKVAEPWSSAAMRPDAKVALARSERTVVCAEEREKERQGERKRKRGRLKKIIQRGA